MTTVCSTIVRALVPFQTQYLAAHRAMQCPHVSTVRKAGGWAKHVAATHPVYSRTRADLIRAYKANDAGPADKKAALKAAEEILKAETEAGAAGRAFDLQAAIGAWLATAPRL